MRYGRRVPNMALKFAPGTACPPPDRQKRHAACLRNPRATFVGRLTRRSAVQDFR